MGKLLTCLFTALGVALCSSALAQRHVKHMASWGGHLGRTEKGEYHELSYSTFLTDKASFRLGILREYGPLNDTGKYRAFTSRLFVAPQLFRIGERIYFHLLFGGSGSYERIEDSGADPEEKEEVHKRVVYGPQAGVEADLYLGNRVSIAASGTKGLLLNHTRLDEWPGYASIGLRYHFW
jgi:hypothetical protein